jgi:hypothetical protein
MIYTLIGSCISLYILSIYFGEKVRSNKKANLKKISIIEIMVFIGMVTQASIIVPIIQSLFK